MVATHFIGLIQFCFSFHTTMVHTRSDTTVSKLKKQNDMLKGMMKVKKEQLSEAFVANQELAHANSELQLEKYVNIAHSFGEDNKTKRKSRSSASDDKIKLLANQLATSQANEKLLQKQLETGLAVVDAVEHKKRVTMAEELVDAENQLKDANKKVETLTKENEILKV